MNPSKFHSTFANGNMDAVDRYDGAGNQYDNLKFGYHTSANGHKVRNRLYHIQDLADQDGDYAQDIPQHPYVAGDIQDEENDNGTINSANNFSYDELGQRTKDEKADIEQVEWTASGKVRKVRHTTASGKPDLLFGYDAAGERIMKQVGDPDLDPAGYREHYIRDAQGNIMAAYRYQPEPVPNTNPQAYAASLKVTDRPIYGSKRLGSYTRPMEMVGTTTLQHYPYTQPMGTYNLQYELSDHLGNVATVLTGRLLPTLGPGIQYQAEVLSAQGYEPFGMELTGRKWQSDVSRFGFQGQLKDRELAAIPFKYRMYSPDGSGFWSVDPLAFKYPHNSPYAFAENRVIEMFELEGLEGLPAGKVNTPLTGGSLSTLCLARGHPRMLALAFLASARAYRASDTYRSGPSHFASAPHTRTELVARVLLTPRARARLLGECVYY